MRGFSIWIRSLCVCSCLAGMLPPLAITVEGLPALPPSTTAVFSVTALAPRPYINADPHHPQPGADIRRAIGAVVVSGVNQIAPMVRPKSNGGRPNRGLEEFSFRYARTLLLRHYQFTQGHFDYTSDDIALLNALRENLFQRDVAAILDITPLAVVYRMKGLMERIKSAHPWFESGTRPDHPYSNASSPPARLEPGARTLLARKMKRIASANDPVYAVNTILDAISLSIAHFQDLENAARENPRPLSSSVRLDQYAQDWINSFIAASEHVEAPGLEVLREVALGIWHADMSAYDGIEYVLHHLLAREPETAAELTNQVRNTLLDHVQLAAIKIASEPFNVKSIKEQRGIADFLTAADGMDLLRLASFKPELLTHEFVQSIGLFLDKRSRNLNGHRLTLGNIRKFSDPDFFGTIADLLMIGPAFITTKEVRLRAYKLLVSEAFPFPGGVRKGVPYTTLVLWLTKLGIPEDQQVRWIESIFDRRQRWKERPVSVRAPDFLDWLPFTGDFMTPERWLWFVDFCLYPIAEAAINNSSRELVRTAT